MPRRYHLEPLNGFQLLSPTALGGPADYFGGDNYWETVFSIGLVPLMLAAVAILRHPQRKLVCGWLRAGCSGRLVCLWPQSRILHRALSRGARDELVPRAGPVAVPGESRAAVLAGMGMQALKSVTGSSAAWRKLCAVRSS